jgi:hypothetical protein
LDTHEVIVAFRGTQNSLDWEANLDAIEIGHPVGGAVHKGFYELYQTIKPELCAKLASLVGNEVQDIYVTGHSLGGALSTLATVDIQQTYGQRCAVHHYSFASPAVGDPQFAEAYRNLGITTSCRMANLCDDVPLLPLPSDLFGLFAFEHVGYLMEFYAHYGSIVENHKIDGAYLYALNHSNDPVDPVRRLGAQDLEAIGTFTRRLQVTGRKLFENQKDKFKQAKSMVPVLLSQMRDK